MNKSKGLILYRFPLAIYLMLALVGFIFPLGIGVTFSHKGDWGAVVKGLIIGFVPYIAVALILVLITSLLKLRHTSTRLRKIAMVGSVICTLIVIWSVTNLLNYTSLRWQGTYPDLGTMSGGPEWIAAWVGGSCAGLLVLFLAYLRLSKPLSSTDPTS
jgi:hypothetical protein